MNKTQHISHTPSDMASEQTATYGVQIGYRPSTEHASKEKRILSNTMPVDEYFDKLLSLVHDDYANL